MLPTPDTETNPIHIQGWQRLLIHPLALVAKLWMKTLRFETTPQTLHTLTKRDTPLAFIVWHNRLFLVGEIYRRYRAGRTIYALVSASKDGAWLAEFLHAIGMNTLRGSSNHNPRQSATLLINALKQGHDIGITPDGPRGPMYDFKPGAITVARRARAPAALFGAQFEHAWRLRSWDHFYLPRPFSRVHLHCRLIPPENLTTPPETIAQHLRALNPDTTTTTTPHP